MTIDTITIDYLTMDAMAIAIVTITVDTMMPITSYRDPATFWARPCAFGGAHVCPKPARVPLISLNKTGARDHLYCLWRGSSIRNRRLKHASSRAAAEESEIKLRGPYLDTREHFAAVYACSDLREEARPIASHLHTMHPPPAPPHMRTRTICPLPRDACFRPPFEVPRGW